MFAYDRDTSRRGLLTAGLGFAAAATLLPKSLLAAPMGAPERAISLLNLHTGESVRTVYWADGTYQPEGLASINKVLRDFRTGDVHPIDPQLMDLANEVRRLTGATNKPLHIISGYRSPKTNGMLHNASARSGVATRSLHMDGKALDIRIPGVDLSYLHKAAVSLKEGGVGYYPKSDFVHVDTGRVRYW